MRILLFDTLVTINRALKFYIASYVRGIVRTKSKTGLGTTSTERKVPTLNETHSVST